jgi:hypothetical protein
MKTRHLIAIILFALFAFGGTFTCTSSNDSDEFTKNPTTPAK